MVVAKFASSASYTSKIPHLEGEDAFGSMKRKQDLPPKLEGDFHNDSHLNLFCPQMEFISQTLHLMQFRASGAICKRPFQFTFIITRKCWNTFVVMILAHCPQSRMLNVWHCKKTPNIITRQKSFLKKDYGILVLYYVGN